MFDKINPIITTNFKSNVGQKATRSDLLNENKKTKGVSAVKICTLALAVPTVVALSYLAVIEHKKPARLSFEKLLAKNNLELKDGVLKNKNTGEKYTGELKRSTGELFQDKFYEKIESQKFENGVIKERTYKNWKGDEVNGYFYKDGKIRLEVSSVIGKNKNNFGFNDFNKEGQACSLGEGLLDKDDSLFEWARRYVKNHDW